MDRAIRNTGETSLGRDSWSVNWKIEELSNQTLIVNLRNLIEAQRLKKSEIYRQGKSINKCFGGCLNKFPFL